MSSMRIGRALAITIGAATVAMVTGATAPAAVGGGCAVTLPTHVVPPHAGFSAAGFNYGNARLRVHLNWSDGVLRAGRLPGGGFVAVVAPDRSIYAKLGWWRGVAGRFRITGHRLDRPAPPLRVSLHVESYPTVGFIPSGLTFPTTGCWRVTASQGTGRLSFVVKVTRASSRGASG